MCILVLSFSVKFFLYFLSNRRPRTTVSYDNARLHSLADDYTVLNCAFNNLTASASLVIQSAAPQDASYTVFIQIFSFSSSFRN